MPECNHVPNLKQHTHGSNILHALWQSPEQLCISSTICHHPSELHIFIKISVVILPRQSITRDHQTTCHCHSACNKVPIHSMPVSPPKVSGVGVLFKIWSWVSELQSLCAQVVMTICVYVAKTICMHPQCPLCLSSFWCSISFGSAAITAPNSHLLPMFHISNFKELATHCVYYVFCSILKCWYHP